MKKFIYSLVVALFIGGFFIPSSYAKPNDEKEKLDRLADQSLQFAKVDRREEAAKLLQVFSKEFMQLATEEHMYTMDEINIITIAEEEALKALEKEEKPLEQVINDLTRFRLAVDAVHSGKYPLWTGMEERVMAAVSQTKDAIKNQDSIAFQEKVNHLLSIYHILYPSIKVDISPERFQQVDAHIQFIDQYRPQVFSDQKSQLDVKKLEGQLKEMFSEMNEDESDPSLWWVIISTGSIIILTLSYVGWRKFKGLAEKVYTKKKNNDR